MSLTVMNLMLVLGIIGHALNMYCDRILSVFPNGTLKLEDIKTFGKDDKMTRLMEGVSAWCSKYTVWYRRKSCQFHFWCKSFRKCCRYFSNPVCKLYPGRGTGIYLHHQL